jgi:hypothetical protein
MAFGTRLTTAGGTATGNSIAASNSISITATVKVGDLIVALMCEQTALTATGATDNLGNTYTAQNAGTLSTVSGRLFWSRVTVAGNLTSVAIAATSSTDDFSAVADAYEIGFDASPVDANPANGTGDITSPFTCPATGTLAQAVELIVCWSANNSNTTWSATSPLVLGSQASQTNTHAVIGTQVTSSTSTQSPAFTGTAPTADVLGTISFKAATLHGQAML